MSHWTRLSTLISGMPRQLKRAGAARRRAPAYAAMEPLEVRELLSTTATHLVIGLEPTNGYVGLPNPFALTVELTDANGNLVTSDHSAITLTDSSGSLAKTITAHPVNGVATFKNLVFTQEGTVTLTATDTADALSVNTGQIVIQAAPAPTTLTFDHAPVSDPTGANPGDVQVSIHDQYGNLYAVPTNVTLSLVDAPAGGKLGGKLTVKTSGGVADFPGLAVNVGGNYKIEANGGGLTLDSDELTMGGPTTATQVKFLQQPTDSAAGVAMTPPVTVEVLDQYGNVITTDHSKVTLTVASGPGTMKKLSASAKNGIATFNKLSLTTLGAYTLSATDGALTGDTSSTFNIAAGPATKLVFESVPANGTAATGPIVVTVDTVDKFGNVDTTNTAAVTLTIAGGPRGTPPQTVAANVVNGEATFDSLTFSSAGRYTLRATADSLISAVAKPFTLV